MEKTLLIDACVRPESRTRLLAQRVLNRLDGKLETVNLERENIQPLNYERMLARDEAVKNEGGDAEAEKDGDAALLRYARQFAEADAIVFAAPYWDLSFPAMVKNYLEAVTVQGVTFYYNEEGIPQGLCRAKRVFYVETCGGPCEGFNFGFDYVKGLCRMLYGIQEVHCFKAEMLDVIGMDVEAIMKRAMEEIDAYFAKEGRPDETGSCFA